MFITKESKLRARQSVVHADGFTYISLNEKGSAEFVASCLTDVIYDSYGMYPSEAPKKVKVHDAMFGPGYWETKPALDEAKKRIKPSSFGPRLIVLDNRKIEVKPDGIFAGEKKSDVDWMSKAVEEKKGEFIKITAKRKPTMEVKGM